MLTGIYSLNMNSVNKGKIMDLKFNLKNKIPGT
jgi:hypothetical protein